METSQPSKVLKLKNQPQLIVDEKKREVRRSDDPGFFARILEIIIGELTPCEYAPVGGVNLLYRCTDRNGSQFYIDNSLVFGESTVTH